MMSAGHGQVEIAKSKAERSSSPVWVCVRPLRAVLHLFALHLFVLFAAATGCARFPAIDPNGQSIFLPYPAATQLTLPQVHATNGNPGIFPNDAYPTPLPPPACVDGSCEQPGGIHNLFNHRQKKKQSIANHFAKKDPGKCGEIRLSPMRIVAPVNGEVLLLAGICGKDGYLLKREPLEWMLAPGSVGNFIEVGDDAKGKLCSSFRTGPKVEKLGVDYARGRTSSKATLLTKGTPGCDDDLEVVEGQTWLSISSPNEGISRVTVLAPDSELWDKRRQTATIYWVDSQANFPEPIRIDTTQVGTLTTRVTRAENRVAAEGWKVRYTIIEPNVIEFLRSDGQPVGTPIFVAEVDRNGMAQVAVKARGQVGVSPVHIEVIRPILPDESLPELNLHQADTFVTVSAPAIDLVINGPQVANVGDTVEFVASLGNPGDINAENATLQFRAPAGMTIIGTRPEPNLNVPNAIAWQQGVLEAGRQVDFVVNLRLDAPGDYALFFKGDAVGLTVEKSPPLRVLAPSVRASMIRVPENTTGQAEVNEVVYYEVGVQNTGTGTLVNLMVQIDTSVGWRDASDNDNKVLLPIAMLQPGQTEIIPIGLRVIQEGQHTATVNIKSAAGDVLQQLPPVGLIGVPPRERRPRVEATIVTEPQDRTSINQTTIGRFRVQNTGETPLDNLDVSIQYDPVLEAQQVSQEYRMSVRPIDNTSLRWSAPRLLPGQVAELKVAFLPRAAKTAAGFGMTVASGETTASTSTRIEIVDPSGGSVLPPGNLPPGNQLPGSNPVPGTNQARSGNWQVSFEALQNPTVVGNPVTFMVDVRNGQNLQDTNLRIQLALPEGMELNSIERAGVAVPATQTSQGVWSLPQEKFIRPGENVRFFFNVTPRIVQEAQLKIGVTSDGQPTTQVQQKSITVNPKT